MPYDAGPTARALLVLELIQNRPGITADRLSGSLGVSERAARRYVGILREAGVPIESVRGRYGGYRVGRGLRLPPLMFTTPEALGLVMAALDGLHGAAEPVDSALGKIIRVLPEAVAGPVEAVRVSARAPDPAAASPDPATTATLAQACASRCRVRLGYRLHPGADRVMEVDPWAVVARRGRWYLLGWSHTKDARRVLRVDKVTSVDVLEETFGPPAELDPVQALEEHLAEGWQYAVDVSIDAPVETAGRWIPRSLGRLEALDAGRTRLVATTDEPDWYAERLTAVKAPFRVLGSPELCEATRVLGQRLCASVLS